MEPFMRAAVQVVSCVASVFVAITYAMPAPAGEEVPLVDQLASVCRAAKADFRPLTAADLREVKAELLQAIARLDRRLDAAGKNGQNWRRYLRWDQMQSELRDGKEPDPAVLGAVYRRYTAEHDGLELTWFVDVREALRQYRQMAQNVGDRGLRARYEQLMDALASHLQAYAAKPTAEEALVIGGAVRQLEEARQAPDLVRAIRHHFVRPNLRLEVSSDLLATAIARPVDETAPVRDVILGTDIYGTGRTVGRTRVELHPDASRGVIDTVFRGATESRNVGYHGPIRIYSNGTTRIDARKRLLIDTEGVASLPTVSKAATKTRITGIRSKRRIRWVERIAWRRTLKQKRQAEYIASRHAEQQVNDRIDQEADDLIGRANETLIEKVRKPLLQRKLFPQQFRFTTTPAAVHVVSLQADATQLAAPSPPPEPRGACDLVVCLHESMLNNLATSALAGMTLRQEKFEATVVELVGELPELLKPDEDEPNWGITFPRYRHPICVTFADGGFRVTVRGIEYYRGGEAYPGMDVTAVYKIVQAEQGFKAVRQGDLRIFPPGFVPGGGRKIPPLYIVIKQLLERRFSRIFKRELLGEGLVLPDDWGEAAKLVPVQLVCQDGWLMATWRRAPAAQTVALNP